jgi:DNA invertase Pin-like site-specific DNA recombinase
MEDNSQLNDYKRQLLEYAKFLADNKLGDRGKVDEENTKRVYVIYARKSTKGKDRQERSIPDQIADCQKVVKDLKIRPVRIFKEKESAKTSGKRSVFSEMIQGIKDGKYNSIIAWHPDRLARNMKEAGEIIDLLDRGKIVTLKFATYTFIRDANGIMTLGIQFVLAKQYSDNLSASSTRGSVHIAKEGKSPTWRPKYGYVVNELRCFRPDGNNFILLQSAFKMALDKYGLEKIADYLNQNDFHYAGKKIRVSKQKLSTIFQDPFYAGVYLYGSEIIDLRIADPTFQSMVTEIDFMELRHSLKDAYSFKKREVKVQLFNKMVYCGYCNHIMSPGTPQSSGKSKNRYLTLRCNYKSCPSRFDKEIKKEVRGKVLFEHIINFLDSGLEVDKKAYNAYLIEAKETLFEKRGELVLKHKSLCRQLGEADKNIELKSNALANARGELIDKINKQIEGLIIERKSLEEEEGTTKNEITTIDHNIKSDAMSYENFLNFFKNLGNMVKNSDDQYLANKVIRMVFLNFEIKDKKVTKSRLNPMFEQYVKIPSVLQSRGGQN